jgi:hypothetical protein
MVLVVTHPIYLDPQTAPPQGRIVQHLETDIRVQKRVEEDVSLLLRSRQNHVADLAKFSQGRHDVLIVHLGLIDSSIVGSCISVLMDLQGQSYNRKTVTIEQAFVAQFVLQMTHETRVFQ